MRISVIIPVKNGAKTIVRALDSVMEQTVKPFEIIVVNDGSSDNTLSVLEGISKIIVIDNQECLGVSAARNKGIVRSTGDYIAFLDADDYWECDHLENFRKHYREDLLLWCTSLTSTNQELREITKCMQLWRNRVFTPTAIIKNDGRLFDESMSHCEDYLFFTEITCEGLAYIHNKKTVNLGHIPGEGIGLSSQRLKMRLGELKMLYKLYKADRISHVAYVLLVSASLTKHILKKVRLL